MTYYFLPFDYAAFIVFLWALEFDGFGASFFSVGRFDVIPSLIDYYDSFIANAVAISDFLATLNEARLSLFSYGLNIFCEGAPLRLLLELSRLEQELCLSYRPLADCRALKTLGFNTFAFKLTIFLPFSPLKVPFILTFSFDFEILIFLGYFNDGSKPIF